MGFTVAIISVMVMVFPDLVGFTELSASKSPHELVELPNELFSRFDGYLETHGLKKIKTSGDAYMAAAGIMQPDPGTRTIAWSLHSPCWAWWRD